jgi:L-threonylcarbamoyladenylate synthase
VRFIDFDVQKPDFQTLKAAAELLADDYPVVFPSDTTYGILMRFSSENAARLHAIRRENTDKPFLVVVSEDFGWQSLTEADALPRENFAAVESYWPGANTLVFAKAAGLAYPVTDSIAIRMPAIESNKAFHTLIQLCDFPVMAPSFNRPGEPVIVTKAEALEKFPDIEYAFWDERFMPGKPSAIYDMRVTPVKQLR